MAFQGRRSNGTSTALEGHRTYPSSYNTQMKFKTGYCTNVHAGADLETTRANLLQHAVAVRDKVCGEEPMGIGLWLSAPTAESLLATAAQQEEFKNWLSESKLLPYTLNGFPYGDFHQPIVKHKVYLPTWWESERAAYTANLIDLLHHLLPDGEQGSISTLPISWGGSESAPGPTGEQLQQAAVQLRGISDKLARLEAETGRLIHIALEPEPGCYLQRSGDLGKFFDEYLLPGGNEDQIRRYLRVCHDVCHAAVMNESQRSAFEHYQSAGVQVGKVQVSSAVILDLDPMAASDRTDAISQLGGFAEDRYLHQTTLKTKNGDFFFEDLPGALAAATSDATPQGRLSVHFHVPVYLEQFGLLGTSRQDIIECLSAAQDLSDVDHYEIETYAWGVLPDDLQHETLADGIAQEIEWFEQNSRG